MSEIWNFSPSVQCKVQQCLAAASKNENNKWFQQFGRCRVDHNLTNTPTENNPLCSDNTIKRIASPIILSDEEDLKEGVEQKVDIKHPNSEDENNEKNYEYLETELENKFDYFVQDCLVNPTILQKLANNLSINTVAKLLKHIYSKNDIDKPFLASMFKYFFPAYLKREYNCMTLDFLLQGNKLFPTEFEILIKKVTTDIEIPNKILQDYIKMISENEQTKYLLILENLDFSTDIFVHNLFSIYTAYKSCTKTEQVQSFILSLLCEHSSQCTTDKNYGRLLLAYLQSMKDSRDNVKFDDLEKIIASHRSAFKRPCLTVFNELRGIQNNKEDSDGSD